MPLKPSKALLIPLKPSEFWDSGAEFGIRELNSLQSLQKPYKILPKPTEALLSLEKFPLNSSEALKNPTKAAQKPTEAL